jgi:hypothetical protein
MRHHGGAISSDDRYLCGFQRHGIACGDRVLSVRAETETQLLLMSVGHVRDATAQPSAGVEIDERNATTVGVP